jgi:hypothetical protein
VPVKKVFKSLISNKTYSNNGSKNTDFGKRVLDVLEVDLSSSERASTLLPARVLGTELLGEVLRVADLIFAEKSIYFLLHTKKSIC